MLFPMTIRVTSEILAYSAICRAMSSLCVVTISAPLCYQADMLLQPCLILRRFLCRFRGLHIQCCKISTKCPGHLCRSPDKQSKRTPFIV